MPPPHPAKLKAVSLGHRTYVGKACKRGHDGTRYVNGNSCVECMCERQKTEHAKVVKAKHYEKNKEKYLLKAQKTYSANREKILAYSSELQKKRLPLIAEKRKQRMQDDELFAIKERVRGLIRECLKKRSHKKKSTTVEILGCSVEFFKSHIERQFLPGMTWGNRSEWEIDHITPVASATNEDELLKLNHFTNMRPLWRTANRSKSAKILFLI